MDQRFIGPTFSFKRTHTRSAHSVTLPISVLSSLLRLSSCLFSPYTVRPKYTQVSVMFVRLNAYMCWHISCVFMFFTSRFTCSTRGGLRRRGSGGRNCVHRGSSENHVIPIRWDSSPVHRSQWRRHVLLWAKAQAEPRRHATGRRQWGQKSSHAFPLTHCLVSSHVLLIACSLLTMHSAICFFTFCHS